jgi:hypothetical protein
LLEIQVPFVRLLVAAACFAGAGVASAAGVGVRAGTTGVGADVAWGLVPTLSARVGYSYLTFNTSVDSTDTQYDAKPKLSNGNLFLDWNPLGPFFRITGGVILNSNKVDVTAQANGATYTIGGTTYPASAIGSLNGTVKSGNAAAPYLGIGYGSVAGAGVNFYFDLGVMFQGSPKASLTATCSAATPAALCSQIQASTVIEANDLQDSIKNFKYFPVASIGVTIGF